MVRGSLMLTLLFSSCALAATAPPPGLLEYLGTMVDSDGQLIDPLALEDIAVGSAATDRPGHDDDTDGAEAPPEGSKETDR